MTGGKKATSIAPPVAPPAPVRKPTLVGVPAPTGALPKGLFSQTAENASGRSSTRERAVVPAAPPPRVPSPPGSAKVPSPPAVEPAPQREPAEPAQSTAREAAAREAAAREAAAREAREAAAREAAAREAREAAAREAAAREAAASEAAAREAELALAMMSAEDATQRAPRSPFARYVIIGTIVLCAASMLVTALFFFVIGDAETADVATPPPAPAQALAAPPAANPSEAVVIEAPRAVAPTPVVTPTAAALGAPTDSPADPSAESTESEPRADDLLQIGPTPEWIDRMTPRQRLRRSREVVRHAMRLESRGDLSEAEAWYRRAQHLRPEQSAIASQLASNLQTQDRHSEAVAWARHAIELAPNLAMPYYILGRILEREGHRDEAIALYRQARERNPRETRVRRRLRYLGAQ